MVPTFYACLWALIALFLGGAWGITTAALLHAAKTTKRTRRRTTMTTADILANLGYILPRLTKEQQVNVFLLANAFNKNNKEREDSHGDS